MTVRISVLPICFGNILEATLMGKPLQNDLQLSGDMIKCRNKLERSLVLNVQQQQFDIDVPVELPVTSEEDFSKLEGFLMIEDNFRKMVTYLSSCRGKRSSVNSCLRHVMTNQLAMSYNYKGNRGKRAFEFTFLNRVIICAAKNVTGSHESEIVNAIKVWLKHSPQRRSLELKKD